MEQSNRKKPYLEPIERETQGNVVFMNKTANSWKPTLILAVIAIVATALVGILLFNYGQEKGRADAEVEIATLKAERDAEIAEVQAEADKKIAKLKTEQEDKITNLQTKHNKEVEKLNNTIAEKDKKIDELINTPAVCEHVRPTITLSVIEQQIEGISELATYEYIYTNAATFTDTKHIKKMEIKITEKSFTQKWDGVIKAGIDVSKVTAKVDADKGVLTIYLPKAQILTHEYVLSSVEVLDEKDGLFNRVTVEDSAKFGEELKTEMNDRAIENGLLEKAQLNAEAVILNMLNMNPDIAGHYTVEFKTTNR